MSSEKPSAPDNSTPVPSTGRGNWIVIGTLGIVISAAIGMQWWRATDGKAAPDSSTPGMIGQADSWDEPVSRVNGDSITYRMLAQECMDRYGVNVLDELINRTIIQQALADRGLEVSEAEVKQKVLEISKKFGLAVDEWYRFIQSERGLTPLQYNRDVIWQLLALQKIAGKNVDITRDMLREAYFDSYGPKVKARMIVLDNPRRAEEFLNELHSDPAKFDAIAREYSIEPTSRLVGGAIPPIRRYSGAHQSIRETAFAMKTPGEISPLIQVDVKEYVILKFEGRTEPVDHDPKEVEATLTEELREREVKRMVAETFDQLRSAARIDNYVTGQNSGIRQTAAVSN